MVESYQQNNVSERLAQEQLSSVPDAAFWLGLMSLDDLSTNTLEAASGSLVPQYAGNYPYHLAFFSFLFPRNKSIGTDKFYIFGPFSRWKRPVVIAHFSIITFLFYESA